MKDPKTLSMRDWEKQTAIILIGYKGSRLPLNFKLNSSETVEEAAERLLVNVHHRLGNLLPEL